MRGKVGGLLKDPRRGEKLHHTRGKIEKDLGRVMDQKGIEPSTDRKGFSKGRLGEARGETRMAPGGEVPASALTGDEEKGKKIPDRIKTKGDKKGGLKKSRTRVGSFRGKGKNPSSGEKSMQRG